MACRAVRSPIRRGSRPREGVTWTLVAHRWLGGTVTRRVGHRTMGMSREGRLRFKARQTQAWMALWLLRLFLFSLPQFSLSSAGDPIAQPRLKNQFLILKIVFNATKIISNAIKIVFEFKSKI
jgi:hypothetical protein